MDSGSGICSVSFGNYFGRLTNHAQPEAVSQNRPLEVVGFEGAMSSRPSRVTDALSDEEKGNTPLLLFKRFEIAHSLEVDNLSCP